MSPIDDICLSLLLVALFGGLLYLRSRFPDASKTSENTVLVAATVLFFSITHVFMRP